MNTRGELAEINQFVNASCAPMRHAVVKAIKSPL